MLSIEQQQHVLDLLAKGISPAAVCQHLAISAEAYNLTRDTDEAFQLQLARIHTQLSQNVAAALYRAAMDGNLSAIALWLKACPPPEWPSSEASAARHATFDETLGKLSDDELEQLAHSVGVDLEVKPL